MKKYLNPSLKKYYNDILEEAIKIEGPWMLDSGIEPYTTSINKSKNIQTIYSKKGKDFANHYYRSYLRIAYTAKVERKLLNEVKPFLENSFKFKVMEIEAHTQEPNNSICGGLNYHNINVIHFELVSKTEKQDQQFWDELQKALSNL